MALKKITVSRSNLPPLVTKSIGTSQFIEILPVEFISDYNGAAAFLITIPGEYKFYTNNIVFINRNKSEEEFTAQVISDVEGFKKILGVLPTTTLEDGSKLSQFYVEAPADANTESIPSILYVSAIPEQYYIRYRVVSEDLNKVSHWSPIYALSGLPQEIENLGNMVVDYNPINDLLTVNWDMPSAATNTQNFDVYVAWGSGPNSVGSFYYYATIAGNNINIPLGAPFDENGVGGRGSIEIIDIESVMISVQVSTLPKKRRVSSLTIAKTQNPYPINVASSSW